MFSSSHHAQYRSPRFRTSVAAASHAARPPRLRPPRVPLPGPERNHEHPVVDRMDDPVPGLLQVLLVEDGSLAAFLIRHGRGHEECPLDRRAFVLLGEPPPVSDLIQRFQDDTAAKRVGDKEYLLIRAEVLEDEPGQLSPCVLGLRDPNGKGQK